MHNFCLKRSIFIVQHDLKTAYIEHNVNKKNLEKLQNQYEIFRHQLNSELGPGI